jgi:hypothetical protein
MSLELLLLISAGRNQCNCASRPQLFLHLPVATFLLQGCCGCGSFITAEFRILSDHTYGIHDHTTTEKLRVLHKVGHLEPICCGAPYQRGSIMRQ